MARRPALRHMILLFLGLLLTAGCTSPATPTPSSSSSSSKPPVPVASQPPGEGSASATSSPGTTDATGPTDDPTTGPPWGLETTAGEGSGDPFNVMTGIRLGDHSTFDRIVIDMEGRGKPGWWASYVDEPIQAPTDNRAPLDGTAFIEVLVRNIDWSGELGISDYSGTNPVVQAKDSAVTGVFYGGAFEGDGQILIGLNGEQRPYRVFTLSDPTRVVIDVEKP